MPCSVKGFRNALVVCPALRFTRRIKKLVAKVSARPFLRGVRSAWMPSSVLSCRQLWEPGISGLKSCNKPTYQKLFTAALNLSISGLIASFGALRAMIRAKTPRSSPADALLSLVPSRARRKKGENGASAPAFFDAPSIARRVIQENYASLRTLQRLQGARWVGIQYLVTKGLTA